MKQPFFRRLCFWLRKPSRRCGHCSALLKPVGLFGHMHPLPLCHFAVAWMDVEEVEV